MAKLTTEDVSLIRELIAEKVQRRESYLELTNEKIAEKFDLTRRTVDRIENGETWI